MDYSLPVEKVYTEFAEALIRMIGLWHRSSKYRKLPPWVPDWSNTSLWTPLDVNVKYNGHNPEVLTMYDGYRTLKVAARSIGEFESIRHKLYEMEVATSNLDSREVAQYRSIRKAGL